jgi:NADH-quinone oxidoreductase subunit F
VLKAPHVTSYLTEHFADDAFGMLEGYLKRGGYQAAKKAIGEMTPEAVVELVKSAGLQGRGGAGFATGLKWSFMPRPRQAEVLVCNADESEPSSLRTGLMERGPHQLEAS